MGQNQLTDRSDARKASTQLNRNNVNASLIVHAFGAAPSLPLSRLRVPSYRIADDADADLHVPGFEHAGHRAQRVASRRRRNSARFSR